MSTKLYKLFLITKHMEALCNMNCEHGEQFIVSNVIVCAIRNEEMGGRIILPITQYIRWSVCHIL